MTKREKCAEAGREVHRVQREYLKEVAGELKQSLKWCRDALYVESGNLYSAHLKQADEALEKARRLGL